MFRTITETAVVLKSGKKVIIEDTDYEFNADLWGHIKSYLFKTKCDVCLKPCREFISVPHIRSYVADLDRIDDEGMFYYDETKNYFKIEKTMCCAECADNKSFNSFILMAVREDTKTHYKRTDKVIEVKDKAVKDAECQLKLVASRISLYEKYFQAFVEYNSKPHFSRVKMTKDRVVSHNKYIIERRHNKTLKEAFLRKLAEQLTSGEITYDQFINVVSRCANHTASFFANERFIAECLADMNRDRRGCEF